MTLYAKWEKVENSKETTETVGNPQTSDNISLYLILFITSIANILFMITISKVEL